MPEFIPQHAVASALVTVSTAAHAEFRAAVARRPGDGARGAPMGWSNTPGESLPLRSHPANRASAKRCKVELHRVALVQGYDPEGYYYGSPDDLWEAAADAAGAQPFRFRAPNRAAAQDEARRHYPRAEFLPSAALEDFLTGYLACAEWLCRDDMDRETGEVSEDRRAIVKGWTRASLKAAREDCAAFVAANESDLESYTAETGRDMGSAGHDFYLSRNGHGAGYFDRGHGACLDRLQDAAGRCGEADSNLGRGGWMRFGW